MIGNIYVKDESYNWIVQCSVINIKLYTTRNVSFSSTVYVLYLKVQMWSNINKVFLQCCWIGSSYNNVKWYIHKILFFKLMLYSMLAVMFKPVYLQLTTHTIKSDHGELPIVMLS